MSTAGSSFISTKESETSSTSTAYYTSSSDMRLIKAYTFTGAMSSVLMFNMLLNAAVPFETVIWEGVTLSVWLNACFMMAVFITAVVCVASPMLSTKKCIPHVANAVSIAGAVLIALVAQLFPSTDAPQWVIVVLPAFAAVMGIGSGLQQTHMFNICALWPEDMIILASSSGGFGGIYSFAVFTILSNIFSKSLSSQQSLVWAQFAFGMVVPLLNSAIWFMLAPREVTSRSLAKLTDEQVNVMEEGEVLVATKKWHELLKANSLSLFNAVFVLIVSFSLFPGVVPLSFGYSYTWTSVFIGLWQVLDTVFRYIPAFGWFPKLNRTFWLLLVLVRVVLFIPLFVVPMRGNMLPEWAMVIGFVLFVATNSVTATVMNHDFIVRVDTPADIKLTAGLLIAGCNGGVFLGSLIANLYTL